MIMTNKLLPVALVTTLIGGSVGALVMHSRNQSTAGTRTTAQVPVPDTQYARYQADQTGREQYIPAEFSTAPEQNAYKSGFSDGFKACESGVSGNQLTSGTAYTVPRVVYRNAGRSYAPRRVYYDYRRPRSRSFWQKHRDKLTVAMGTGAGAILGGVIGGKKGAAIGALGGVRGPALYTYKIRKRNRR